MITKALQPNVFVCLFLFTCHDKSQSTALPWGDINVIVLTDVHSWVAGQRHLFQEPADYGNVLSFYEQLPHEEHAIFFVMNGDFMDGTGLSTIPPTHLLPILEHMPWHAVNMGNHELYHSETVEYMMESGFIDHWKGNYLTSNVVWSASGDPIGSRYTTLHASRHNTRILTFGFLYNFQGNCNTTKVLRVQDVVAEEWFHSVLREEEYDAILILAHMDYEDELVSVIQMAIREMVGPSMPIQFINGHSHRRGSAQLDSTSAAMEAGHFLDTVGFVSFPVKQTVLSTSNSTASLFQNAFIDAAVPDLALALGQAPLRSTESGAALSTFIRNTRNSLGLEQPIGCAPKTFRVDLPLDDPGSIWKLYMDFIAKSELLRQNQSLVYVQGTGLLRYDLFAGPVTLDDVIAVTPFNDTVFSVMDNLDGVFLRAILRSMEDFPSGVGTMLPAFASTLSSHDVIDGNRYALLTSDFDAPRLCHFISTTAPEIKSSCRPFVYKLAAKGHIRSTPTDVLMTDLWISYIQNQWFCEWHREDAPNVLFLLSIFFLFSLFGFLFYHIFAVGNRPIVEFQQSSETKPKAGETLDEEKTPLIRNHTGTTSHDDHVDETAAEHKRATSLILPQNVLASVIEKETNNLL